MDRPWYKRTCSKCNKLRLCFGHVLETTSVWYCKKCWNNEAEYQEVLRLTREAMDNPPAWCDECSEAIGEFNRTWEGCEGKWLCDQCYEKVTPQ